jgi:hypothetical protein
VLRGIFRPREGTSLRVEEEEGVAVGVEALADDLIQAWTQQSY